MALSIKHQRKHIFVHPAQQNKLYCAVKTALMRDKRKFSDTLEGALMDVSNLRIIGKHYLIVDGFLSMEVEADFQVFCPNIGMRLEGVVNKISRGHIGCLVMDLFNTSIAIPRNSSVVLNIGDKCEFSVTEVIIDGDILSLRGSLSNFTSEKDRFCTCFGELESPGNSWNIRNLTPLTIPSKDIKVVFVKYLKERQELKEQQRGFTVSCTTLFGSYFVQQSEDSVEKEDGKTERKEVFGEITPDAEKDMLKCTSSTSDSLFEQGVLTQANQSVKKSLKKSKKGIKEEQQHDEQKVIETSVRVSHGELGTKKKSKSPKKRNDKRHTGIIDLPDCIIDEEKNLSTLELESNPQEPSSPLKKSKKRLSS